MSRADLRRDTEFFGRLSEQSRYLRFMMATRALPASVLAAIALHARDPRCAVLVAFVRHATGGTEIIGGGRIVNTRRTGTCEFALTVVDSWQGRGVGSLLLRELILRARALRYHRIEGSVLAINVPMLKVASGLGLRAQCVLGDPTVVNVSRMLWPLCGRRFPGARPALGA
jgi:RimJ/RimL family protein N-acetyltransferase